MNTLAFFIIILTVLLVIGLFIIVYALGRMSIKDNSQQAFIFCKTGLHIGKPIKAKLDATTNKGSSFVYNNSVLFVPKDYSEVYYKQRRMLFVNRKGQLIASPFGKDLPINEAEKETLIYELVASHIGADGMRALRSKQSLSLIIVAAAAFIIGIVGTFAVVKFQETRQQQQVQQVQQVQPITITPQGD